MTGECSVPGCPLPVTTAMRFRDQGGHVHYCDPHAAVAREWFDIRASVGTPCPWGPHRMKWTDNPPELV